MGDPTVSTRRSNRVRLAIRDAGWSWLTVTLVLFTVIAVTGIVSAISYDHETYLATSNGQPGWVSALNPFTIDGLLLSSTVVLFWAASRGIRGWGQLWRPAGVLVVGILATIGANLAAGLVAAWLRPVVSAWPGVALVLVSDVAFWLMSKLRAVANGEETQPAVACDCPRPATSLADALVLARAELRSQGKPAGEQALADAFGVTRHQVRQHLAGTVEPAQPDTSVPPDTAPLNGHPDVSVSA
jgi:hypothetical protein